MSLDLQIYIRRSDIPDRIALQASLDALHFEIRLDPGFELTQLDYCVCRLKQAIEAGFEISSGSIEGNRPAKGPILPENVDTWLMFTWHSDELDSFCACAVAAALAQRHDALIAFDNQLESDLEAFTSETRGALNGYDPEENAARSRADSRGCDFAILIFILSIGVLIAFVLWVPNANRFFFGGMILCAVAIWLYDKLTRA